jgi:hypothetical protein
MPGSDGKGPADVATGSGITSLGDGKGGGLGKWIAVFMIGLGLVAAFFAMKKGKASAAS